MDIFSLKGKVAIVTGANTGLGQGICVGLAQAGADIIGVSRSKMDETQGLVEKSGVRFIPLIADLQEMSSVQYIIQNAVKEYSKIDILINNAGIIRREDALNFNENDWDSVMNINIKTLFFLSQAAANQFVKQNSGGKIINIASMLSFQGGIRVPAYTASKSAVNGLTKALANEWAKYNINVNAIAPGYMVTNNTEQLRNDPVRNKAILERIPAGRWGNPSDIAGTAVFLSSNASDYVNGFTIAVDGGWLAR